MSRLILTALVTIFVVAVLLPTCFSLACFDSHNVSLLFFDYGTFKPFKGSTVCELPQGHCPLRPRREKEHDHSHPNCPGGQSRVRELLSCAHGQGEQVLHSPAPVLCGGNFSSIQLAQLNYFSSTTTSPRRSSAAYVAPTYVMDWTAIRPSSTTSSRTSRIEDRSIPASPRIPNKIREL
ncbi:hypothetical protein L596_001649 [Steinernema carpocapsae]|uniref:Secreted protein n=1 Tax=Steinernema carpocapsae TaxID=34508 RepID=A0A4U8UNW0_STECR|nr:hypothetical protein L596_001649 [Steinernema carpocapsae]